MKTVGMKTSRESVTDTALIIEEKLGKPGMEGGVRRYSRGKMLGKGGFARCFEIVNLDTQKLSAAKIITKASLIKSRAKQKLMSEIKIHRSLNYKNVVKFEHFFEDHENVYIILELCSNQTLNELVKRRRKLLELEVQCYMLQMIEGLKYIHSHKVIHRDLKLGNLFLNEKMELKLADFGLAAKLEFDGEKKRTICGTPNYIAPEILEGRGGHSYEVDIWSLGVILYTLLVGKPPFETHDVKTTYRRIKMNIYGFPEGCGISDAARSLVKRILCNDPTKRPKLDDILAHEFMTSNPIPAFLPTSTLACPPSTIFLQQYIQKCETTAPLIRLENTIVKIVVLIFFIIMLLTKKKGENYFQHCTSFKENMEKKSIPIPLNTDRGLHFQHQSKPILASARILKIGEKSNHALPSDTPEIIKKEVCSVQPKATVQGPEVWVKKWVDYSSKYGLGYLLSNGASGVFYNDSTKIILDSNGSSFDYIERVGAERLDVANAHKLDEYPKSLHKKVTLLQHFRSYLEGEVAKSEEHKSGPRHLDCQIYVKKWLKTKHAIMFRLSNKVVQVNFQDNTEIILSSESKVVTYVNKQGERENYALNSALESANSEMAKRLKYTKEILTRMLTHSTPRTANPPPSAPTNIIQQEYY